MKKALMLAAVICITGCSSTGGSPRYLQTETQRVAYAVGYETGKMLRDGVHKQGLLPDLEPFFAGMKAVIDVSSEQYLDKESLEIHMEIHKQKILREIEAENRIIAEANRREGDSFRALNAAREGVETLESGLQYEIIEAGPGQRTPAPSDTVMAKYKTFHVNGDLLDQSPPDRPVTIQLARVIEGWQVAFQRMSPGDRWKIVLPPELAYGEDGAGKIDPNMTLVYEIELVSINEPTGSN